MNTPLQDIIGQAEARLDPDAREELAELISTFVAGRQESAEFTPAEMEHLRVLDVEPFEAADPAEVAEVFSKARG